MKRIQDIYIPEEDMSQDIFVGDSEGSGNQGAYVEKEKKLILDITDDTKSSKDIVLKKQQAIQVSKKQGKFFDSLEKIGNFRRMFFSQNITLKQVSNNRDKAKISLLKYKKKLRYFSSEFRYPDFVFWSIVFCICTISFCLYSFIAKNIVESRVIKGYEKLEQVYQDTQSIEERSILANNARFDFLLADILFTPYKILPGRKISSVKNAISGGKYLTKSLDKGLELYMKVDNFIEQKALETIYFSQLGENLQSDVSFLRKNISLARKQYEAIKWLPSDDLVEQKQQLVVGLNKVEDILTSLDENYDTFVDMLGHNGRKKYLVVFQNADEIRPMGGFMGSMALVDLFKGRVQLFQSKDVYAIEWDLKKAEYTRLSAPKGLDQLTDIFGLRDANYYANTRDSSRAIQFFLHKAGIDLDGIMYINQNIILDLLSISGPIYIDEIDMYISSQNFSEVISTLVEAKVFKEGTLGSPKEILFIFMKNFFQELSSQGAYSDYAGVLSKHLTSRDMIFWSFDHDAQELLGELGVKGNTPDTTTLDMMYPVFTSLSGNKSDRYMKHSYDFSLHSGEDNCDYNVSMTINSRHNMLDTDRERLEVLLQKFGITNPGSLFIQGVGENKQFVRIVFPMTHIIEPSDKYAIVDHGSRQSVEFFMETRRSGVSDFSINYTILNPSCSDYSTTVIKQPGIREFDVSITQKGESESFTSYDSDFVHK